MGYYIELLLRKMKNGIENGWEKKNLKVLVCGRCGEIDRESTIIHDGRCTKCGLEYNGACEQ